MGHCRQSTWGRGGKAPCLASLCQTVHRRQDVRPVPSGVAVYDGLVACRLQYQCLPLLRPGRGCAIARTPDAGAPAECGMPRVWCIALGPVYASRNLRRAVVVDEALPAVC